MNAKKAKRLRRQAERLTLQTYLLAEPKGMKLKHGQDTQIKIYRDLKTGKLK